MYDYKTTTCFTCEKPFNHGITSPKRYCSDECRELNKNSLIVGKYNIRKPRGLAIALSRRRKMGIVIDEEAMIEAIERGDRVLNTLAT